MLKARGRSGARTGTKILLEAMTKDQFHLARFVLDALDGEIVDSKGEGEQTPLISSIQLPDGRTRCRFAELLLQRGASVNGQDGAGRTALSHACEGGDLDAVKTLVRNNADPEIPDRWGNTALMYAAVAGHSPVVDFLVRAFKRLGLHVDRRNEVGNSAVELAKFLGHAQCVSALTSLSKKGRGVARGDVNDKFEGKVGLLVDKLHLLQTIDGADCTLLQHGSRLSRPRVTPSRVPSMGSIEENDGGSSGPPQEPIFSGLLTPKPPPRASDQSPISEHPETLVRTTSDDHLPPLKQSHGAKQSVFFFSPQPTRITPKPGARSALGIMLTPILADKRESDAEKSRSDDSYYQKRCSLPTSLLGPAPPERALAPLRKPRTARTEPAHSDAATPKKTLAALGDKLLRRFTSSEFKRDAEHPQVDGKPSVDSISSVTCEFDFHFRAKKA